MGMQLTASLSCERGGGARPIRKEGGGVEEKRMEHIGMRIYMNESHALDGGGHGTDITKPSHPHTPHTFGVSGGVRLQAHPALSTWARTPLDSLWATITRLGPQLRRW